MLILNKIWKKKPPLLDLVIIGLENLHKIYSILLYFQITAKFCHFLSFLQYFTVHFIVSFAGGCIYLQLNMSSPCVCVCVCVITWTDGWPMLYQAGLIRMRQEDNAIRFCYHKHV